ncbi:hypothetical protein ABPG72_021410 [Tetrahymena utriculariae]
MSNSKFDLFSSNFFFKVNGKSIRQGTSFRSFLSFVIITLAVSYLCYLLGQYFKNQIDPNKRAYNFTNNQSIDLDLSEYLISFRFEYDYNLSVDVFYQMIPIDIVKCKNPNLVGFYCLDYSTLSHSTLVQNNIDNIQNQIQIFVYGCLDQDFQKTTVPNYCAKQQEINDVVNGINAVLKVQIKTSQYNVKSKQFQTAYRNSSIFTLTSQYIQSTLKIQKQITTVKEGLFFQSEQTEVSPFHYDFEVQTLDRQSAMQLMNLSCYSQSSQSGMIVDQLYQQVHIQYPTIPSILALPNSVFSILMLIGFIGRRFSLKSIDKKFFTLLFQNMFQQSYIQILSLNNLLEQKLDQFQQNNLQNVQVQGKTDESEEIKIQKQYESAIDKSNFLSLSLQFKPMKILNMQNSVNNKEEHQQSSIKIDFQSSQKRVSELNIPNILSFQDQKEAIDESCNQSKKFLQITNKFKEKQLQNERLFQQLNEQKCNRIKVTSISLYKQKQQNINKYLKTKKFINDKKIFYHQMPSNNKISLMHKDFDRTLKNSKLIQFYQDILFLKKVVIIYQANNIQLPCSQQDALLNSQNLISKSLKRVNLSYAIYVVKTVYKIQFHILKLEQSLSHYEEQFAIQLLSEFKIENIKKYLQKCQNKNNLSTIDTRILSSISSTLKF